jgi:UDP-glucose 4-epimerase
MRIVVTGGAGFIGSHVVDTYIGAGHEVLVVDDLSTGRQENINPAARFERLDIRSPELWRLFGEFRPEVLNHHAAQMDVRKSVSDPRHDADINIGGFLNLLEASRRQGLKRVVFASSGGAAYGDVDQLPTPETVATAPASPYGVAKVASELYLGCFQQMYGVDFVALRYANIYGPRQSSQGEAGVVAIFTSRCLSGGTCVINGDGKQTRDYVFVTDVARANLAALTAPGGRYNIGTGLETDVYDLHGIIAKATGSRTPAVFAPKKTGEQKRSCLDASLASRVLGWRPQVELEAGIAKTVEWFKARPPAAR